MPVIARALMAAAVGCADDPDTRPGMQSGAAYMQASRPFLVHVAQRMSAPVLTGKTQVRILPWTPNMES